MNCKLPTFIPGTTFPFRFTRVHISYLSGELFSLATPFRSFSPTPRGLEFRPGQDYYFISTSSRCFDHSITLLLYFSQPKHFQTRPAPPGGGQLLDAQHEGDLQGGRQQGGGGRGGQDQAAGHQPAEEPRRGEQPDDGERETDRGCQ